MGLQPLIKGIIPENFKAFSQPVSFGIGKVCFIFIELLFKSRIEKDVSGSHGQLYASDKPVHRNPFYFTAFKVLLGLGNPQQKILPLDSLIEFLEEFIFLLWNHYHGFRHSFAHNGPPLKFNYNLKGTSSLSHPLPKLPRRYNINPLPVFKREEVGIACDNERGISYPRACVDFLGMVLLFYKVVLLKRGRKKCNIF